MVDYAKRIYPNVHVTLHAGELAPGLVPPVGLRFHIREAVELGTPERIAPGVDVMYRRSRRVTRRDARSPYRGEINLTSNVAVILDIRGNEHPFPICKLRFLPCSALDRR